MAREEPSSSSSPPPSLALPAGFRTLEEYGESLCSFLHAHRTLFDFRPSDDSDPSVPDEKAVHFVVLDHWRRRVPTDWRDFFASQLSLLTTEHSDASYDDLESSWIRSLLDMQSGRHDRFGTSEGGADRFHGALPETLLEFLKNAAALTPPIDASRIEGVSTEPEKEGARRRWDEGPAQKGRKGGERGTPEEAMVCLMKQKKKYETRALGNLVCRTAEETGCQTVVDVGAGKGYVTQFIKAKSPQLDVLAVEGNDSNSRGFQERAESLQNYVEERGRGPEATVVTSRVPLGVDAASFFQKIFGKSAEGRRILLTGLHTCGDLAPTIMKLFLRSTEVRGMAIVGCCYHMLTERKRGDASQTWEWGFPLSRFVSARTTGFRLSTGAHLASNSLPQYTSLEEMRHSGLMHSFRACFEGYVRRRVDPQSAFGVHSHHVGNMRKRHGERTFGAYAAIACEQLLRKLPAYTEVGEDYKQRLRESLTGDGASPALIEKEADVYYSSLHPLRSGLIFEVVAFAALRNLLGPVLEALVLVDRLKFLEESAREAGLALSDGPRLVRIFSPDISPRSYALIAVKADDQSASPTN